MSTVAIHDCCPVCQRRQSKTQEARESSLKSFEEMGIVLGRLSYRHLRSHIPEIKADIKGHYDFPEETLDGAADGVFRQLWERKRKYNGKTIEVGLVNYLRHQFGGNEIKDHHSKTLGAETLRGFLTKKEWKVYQDRLDENAFMILRKLCKKHKCWWHKHPHRVTFH